MYSTKMGGLQKCNFIFICNTPFQNYQQKNLKKDCAFMFTLCAEASIILFKHFSQNKHFSFKRFSESGVF